MFVGVNGVGKTTTIAKVAQREADDGHRVVLAAADTFRAAAAEQLAHWADGTGAGIVRGQEGADPGSVVFDAMSAAASRDADLVLVDTAGRLHTKVNLMDELEKLRRIVERTPGALKEVLLVLDATTGQNGLTQARQFAEAVDVTGVVLTKLDGTAKGGIVLAIEAELGIPVKLVGVGESAADLVAFEPEEFVDALARRVSATCSPHRRLAWSDVRRPLRPFRRHLPQAPQPREAHRQGHRRGRGEIRLALLEADVNVVVARNFIGRVKERAQGAEVAKSLSPAQQVIKIVHEELVADPRRRHRQAHRRRRSRRPW